MNSLPKFEMNFPFKTLTPIIVEPTYETINHLKQELYANESSIPSTLGGGNTWTLRDGDETSIV